MEEKHKLARQWAEKFKADAIYVATMGELAAAADVILEHVSPLTMEGVEWDDNIHRGLGAVDDAGQEWVMLQDDGPYISLIGLDLNPVGAKREELTPNGKRYELREIKEPGHPKVLETVEDYENAPKGTIVAHRNGSGVDLKYDENDWRYTGLSGSDTDFDMAGSSRRVLRWGGEA